MGEHLVELVSWLAARKSEPLRMVECGTIRNPSFDGHEDGLSTYFLAQWCKERAKGDELYSFELVAGNIHAAKKFLAEHSLDGHVQFALGDAELLLEHFCLPLDFAYLDAGPDVFQNLAQFRRCQKWLRHPAFVVIDDVYDLRTADRGLITVPYAKLEGLKTAKIADRMAVIAFGDAAEYPLEWH